MPSLPLALCWITLLSGYFPYSMGLAFLNPILLTGYGLLGFLVGAHLGSVWAGFAATAGTTLLGLVVVNVTGGWPETVLPGMAMLGANLLLSFTSVLGARSLRGWLERRGVEGEAAKLRLSAGFAAAAAAFYWNGALPYGMKMWIAAHTTTQDLILFSLVASTLFVGIWRMTQ
jgi:hypothetical protein